MSWRNKFGVTLVTALVAVSGLSTAQAGITDTLAAAANAAGGAAGSYEVDATGAAAAAAGAQGDARGQALGQWDAANAHYEEARDGLPLYETMDVEPELPVDDVPLEAINTIEAAHADELQKSLDVETGLVNAKANATAWGSVKAFFTGVAGALSDIAKGITSALNVDTSAQDDVRGELVGTLDTVDDVRTTVDAVLRADATGPQVEPRISGEYAFEQSYELTSDVSGIISMP